ncbi:MAG: hypothetical protein K2Q32_08465 [Alphaproteobacteria bacterium]|nr:hypothetical protein [Alphaproteobacteria bacterium]
MAVTDQPADNNVYNFTPRPRAGQQRVMRVKSNNILVADNSPLGGFQNLSNESDGFDKHRRTQLAEAHIDLFEQKLRLENPHIKRLDDETRRKIISIAQDPSNKSPETVVQAVIIATSQSMPEPSAALDKFLQHHNISKEEYFNALGKVGAGMNPEQVLAAYRALKAKEAMGLAADGIGYLNGNSTGFPGYAGRALNTESEVHNYSNANYGIIPSVSKGLYEAGIRSSAQVDRVMGSVDTVSTGVSRGLGITYSEGDKRIIRNDTAVSTAKLVKVAGDRMPKHEANAIDDVKRNTILQLQLEDAIAKGDKAREEQARAMIAANDALRDKKIAETAKTEAERIAAREAGDDRRKSHLKVIAANPDSKNKILTNKDLSAAELEVLKKDQAEAAAIVAKAADSGGTAHEADIAARSNKMAGLLGDVGPTDAPKPESGKVTPQATDASKGDAKKDVAAAEAPKPSAAKDVVSAEAPKPDAAKNTVAQVKTPAKPTVQKATV